LGKKVGGGGVKGHNNFPRGGGYPPRAHVWIRVSEDQRIRGSEDQRIRGSEDQRIRGPENQRIRGSENQRIIG
jgi:hypothetical protein